jgi:hypothetical protein
MQNFSDPVVYTVTAEDGSIRKYEVEVSVKTQQSAEIVWFDLELPGRPGSPAEGVVNQPPSDGVPGEIVVHVPSGTSLASLKAKIGQTGKSVSDGRGQSAAQTLAALTGNFSNPVTYTVTAEDGGAKNYDVTVIVDKSGVKEITKFSFNVSNEIVMIGPDLRTDGKIPIMAMIPVSTGLNSLVPGITYKGAALNGAGVSNTHTPDFAAPQLATADAAQDFTNPQTYTVTAEDGSIQDYVVSVYHGTVNTPAEDNDKRITGFYFTSPSAAGIIDEAAKTIDVTVPTGTNLTNLNPAVYYTGVSLDPASGRAVDFSSPVSYTVTARNGTAQPYTVRVKPIPASTKEITAVSFPGISVVDTVIGAIPDSGGHIPVSVTVSGQTDISALRPTITHTGVSITPPGGTAQALKSFTDSSRHFGSPQVYRITAEDGSVQDYTVLVHVSGGGAKVITGFMFRPASAVGQINQDTHTIEVNVPHSADISGLAPTITYLGKSVGYADTSGAAPAAADTNTAPPGKTGNTHTDAPRDFSADRFYMVTAVDGSTQEYTVTVSQIPEVTIDYEGLRDDKFITESFDPNTGLLTIEVTGAGYDQPYDWYVDSIKQPLAETQNTLVIRTADFLPGRHQVTASAKRSSDNKHYTNIVYFLVQE